MEHATWTAEVPGVTAAPAGLGEFEVRSADDRRVAVVAGVVDVAIDALVRARRPAQSR